MVQSPSETRSTPSPKMVQLTVIIVTLTSYSSPVDFVTEWFKVMAKLTRVLNELPSSIQTAVQYRFHVANLPSGRTSNNITPNSNACIDLPDLLDHTVGSFLFHTTHRYRQDDTNYTFIEPNPVRCHRSPRPQAENTICPSIDDTEPYNSSDV